MGDYLRLVLTNRGGNQFDFGTNKQHLEKTLGSNLTSLKMKEKFLQTIRIHSPMYLWRLDLHPHRTEKSIAYLCTSSTTVLLCWGPICPFALPQLNYRDDFDRKFEITYEGN